MSKKIQLTPAILEGQAKELENIESDLNSLFSGVSSELKSLNKNWSPNLSNNFSGKITSAQKTFSNLCTDLKNGAVAARTSANTFASVDSELAKTGYSQTKLDKQAYGATTVKKETKANNKKKSFLENIKNGIKDFGETVITTTKNTYSKLKNIYDEHGWVYDVVEYSKCAVKVVSAVVKIAGSVAAISSGVGIPIAICGIISAGNDVINAFTDAAYIYTNQYDEVGANNWLKDLLVKNGGEIGEWIGNKEAGEFIGNLAYFGLDLVSFLNGADKMLKSFGKANTVLTGSAKYSSIWGETDWDDVLDSKIKFDLKADYFIRKGLKIDPSSTGNIIYEAGKNVVSTIKKASSIGEKIADLVL